MSVADPVPVPSIPFGRIQGRLNRLLIPSERGTHILVAGMTGSGKTVLIKRGLLPLFEYERILVLDFKEGADSDWNGFGRDVAELPPEFSAGPAYRWRMIMDQADPKPQLERALDQVRDEGHCVVVIDEASSATDREGGGVPARVGRILEKGRGQKVTMILGVQQPAYTIAAVKSQTAVKFIGPVGDDESTKRCAKWAGNARVVEPVLAAMPLRRFLYKDQLEGTPLMALTGLSDGAGAAD